VNWRAKTQLDPRQICRSALADALRVGQAVLQMAAQSRAPLVEHGLSAGSSARGVSRAAFGVYRERFGRVAGTAFCVFGAIASIDAVAAILIVQHVSSTTGDVIASTAAAVFAMAGVVIYAGVLDKVVGTHLHGEPDLSVTEIVHVLPLRRLIAADLLLAIATIAGLALFVVPGVIIFTLLSLVGPMITIEDRTVGSAFKRSWQLVRPRFWLTFVLVTLPLQLEQAALHAIDYTALFKHPVIPAFIVNGLLGTVIGSVVGLIEVVLAYQLIAGNG
jgi:hypothetical protein